MHTVTIYGSEHSEIQHNMTFDISMMCRYMSQYGDIIDVTILLTCLNFDIDIESTTIFIILLNYRYIFGILHITNYTVITYKYFSIRSCNKNHRAQDELANPLIYKFIPKYIVLYVSGSKGQTVLYFP